MSAAISDLSSLAALAWDPSLDVRPALLRVQAELFATAPVRDAEAVASFETLALGLLPNVNDAAALAVARLVAPVADTPAAVLRFLVARGGEAARVVIAAAPVLPPGFEPAVLARNPDWAQAVAGRADLQPGEVSDLVGLGDDAVDLALARNLALVLGGRPMADLVARARRREALAAALLARPDLPASDRAALYLDAPAAERDAIRQEAAAAPARALALPRAGREAVDALVERAMAGDRPGFASRLAALLGLPSGAALELDRPERHELLALALAAAGVGEEESVRIFLTLDDRIARSVGTVFRLVEILRTTPRSSAIRLVEAIVGAPLDLRRGGRHQPVHGPAASVRAGQPAARETPAAAALRTAAGRAAG